MNKVCTLIALFATSPIFAQMEKSVFPSSPVFRPTLILTNESPVTVESHCEIVAENGLYQRVETVLTFTNPNARVFEGELEFPLPDKATVCGYQLEVNGTMVPGVVCEKETARVAFENERRKGIDPGVVEHVKGNVWKTRIYPLMMNTPRKAIVAYIVPNADVKRGMSVCEKFGDEIFVASVPTFKLRVPLADRLRKAETATIYWDASMSRHGKTAADRKLLECLPEKGDWTLVVFRNVIEEPLHFTERAELLKVIDALVYDGGTCLREVRELKGFVFSDEIVEPKPRTIQVRKLERGEKPPSEPKAGTLLATAWAANRVEDLAKEAETHKKELIEIGRKYGVASPGTSFIVLERLEQYLTYKIEPPKTLSFHDEWVKRRAAEDDPIAQEKEKANHRSQLLAYWEERIKWWNNPIPPKATPKSGIFENSTETVESVAMANDMLCCKADEVEVKEALPQRQSTITMMPWNPKTPYLTAIGDAPPGHAYFEYLKQRAVYGTSPAFYLDCAGWFFKAKETLLAKRIISNLSELKLEDVGLWRTMGWRLREAGAYDEAVAVFRHVLGVRPEEAQSCRDLALVLAERGKDRFAKGDIMGAACDLEEAMKLLHKAVFEPTARRSGREGNDIQTSVIALEELNGLIDWTDAQDWSTGTKPMSPVMDAVFRRNLPIDLRITLSWDTDETDIDLHVLEPNGEEAFYGNRRTSIGGFVSEDVTTGYGPEEYLCKNAEKGVYKIKTNYFSSHRQSLTGATVVSATIYTDWGRKNETRQILSLHLDKPRDNTFIGEVKFSGEIK